VRALSINERGILFIVASTASFTTCDTLLKLATQSLPPFETIFLRSTFAMLWMIPLLAATGEFRNLRSVFQKRVALRSAIEMLGLPGYIFGLALMPIAEFSALVQLSPILLMLGAGVFLKIAITRLQLAFAGIAFIGAVFVAQPGGAGFSVFAVFGIWTAVAIAARDLVGRTVPLGISGLVVVFGTMLFTGTTAGAAMLTFESFQMPEAGETILLAASAFFLIGGQVFVFRAYRHAEPGAVAPFFYTGALWAVISSGLVFNTLPNALAFTGIVLIVSSGVGVLILTERRQRAKAKSV
jgi:drug/metabolite transporter (DMT)-like permease